MTLKVQEGTILLGKYRVEKQLGHGAMGYVVAARHVDLDEPRAIKLLLPDVLKNADVAERFLREAKACARLKSEHALRVHDFGRLDDGLPVMVMEYLVGEDLQRVLDRRIRLPYDEATSYVLQACEAVAEAHELKIVHRDLKPSNLFLTRRADGTACVKVLDFGISKSLDDAPESAPKLTATNTVMGTPYYMSPEQLRNSKATDARGDIWSLGVILYEFVTGQVPFGGDNFVDISSNAVFRQPLPPTQLFDDVPAEIEKIILRCLEKNPEDRFPSVRELMAALRPLAAGRVIVEFASDFGPVVPRPAPMDEESPTLERPGRDEESDETLPAPPRSSESAIPKEAPESQRKDAPHSYAQRFLRNHTEKLEAQRIARRRKIAIRLASIVAGVGALVAVVMFFRANPESLQSLRAFVRERGASSATANSNSATAPSAPEPLVVVASASASASAKPKIPTRPSGSNTSHATPKSSASASSSSSATAASSSVGAPSASAKPAPSPSGPVAPPKDGGT